jgi:hypothetical protein
MVQAISSGAEEEVSSTDYAKYDLLTQPPYKCSYKIGCAGFSLPNVGSNTPAASGLLSPAVSDRPDLVVPDNAVDPVPLGTGYKRRRKLINPTFAAGGEVQLLNWAAYLHSYVGCSVRTGGSVASNPQYFLYFATPGIVLDMDGSWTGEVIGRIESTPSGYKWAHLAMPSDSSSTRLTLSTSQASEITPAVASSLVYVDVYYPAGAAAPTDATLTTAFRACTRT